MKRQNSESEITEEGRQVEVPQRASDVLVKVGWSSNDLPILQRRFDPPKRWTRRTPLQWTQHDFFRTPSPRHTYSTIEPPPMARRRRRSQINPSVVWPFILIPRRRRPRSLNVNRHTVLNRL